MTDFVIDLFDVDLRTTISSVAEFAHICKTVSGSFI